MPNTLVKQFETLVLYKQYTALHADKISSIEFSKDSRFVLTGSKDMTVRLLNLYKIDNYSPFVFTGHKKKVVNAMFSEDNTRIYSISTDGVMFIWRYTDELTEEFKRKREHEMYVRNMKNIKYRESKYSTDMDIENEDNNDNNDNIILNNPNKYSEFETMISKGRYILEKKQQF